MKTKLAVLSVVAMACLLLLGGNATAQRSSAVLVKLDELESRLNDLETIEKADINSLRNELSQGQSNEAISDFKSIVALLESRVDELALDIDVAKTGSGHTEDETEAIEVAAELRELMASFRASINNNSDVIQPSVGSAQSLEKVNFDGSIRWRSEFEDKDFIDSTAIYERSFLRVRFGAQLNVGEDSRAYIQFQDSRNMGTNSAGLSNDSNLGVHQAYIKVSDLFRDGFTLQIGRFAAPFGRQRLLGAVGWHNVGRTFDGIRGNFKTADYKVDVFTLKIDDRSFGSPPTQKDWALYGAYGFFMQNQLHLFALHDWDQDQVNGEDVLKRTTFGTFFKHVTESGVKLEFDAAIQRGTQDVRDIDGYMVAGDASYGFEASYKPVVGVGFDITSGDDGSDSTKVKSFNNLYYTGHKFRGFMDYFLAPTQAGLSDIIVRGSIKPTPASFLKIDIHFFQTMEDLTNALGNSYKKLGQEIDITGKYNWQEGITFQGGFSTFIATEDWRSEVDRATWAYGMIIASF